MPVCLKCGKEIEKGQNYCGDCGPGGKAQVQELVSLMESSRYKPGRLSRFRGMAIGLVGLMVVILVVTVALMISIPSGPEFDAKLQAAGCRAKIKRIERAVESYYDVKQKYPPMGCVDANHPLVVDEYLHKVWTCPSTHHLYLLSRSRSRVIVSCDSGLKGHKIE
ncbi:MAG: hypothetical protein MUO75_02130 [Actinobacteria bacterium]|nr:hypothetical protein [Actinomycetota bacterium]